MTTRLTLLACICWTLFQCSKTPTWTPTYFEVKDDKGRLIEKYGNENAPDNDVNFHSFYFYNDRGQVVKERTHYFLDATYVVKDTTDYVDILYVYDKDGNKDKEIRVHVNYDSLRAMVIRDTIYITDLKTNTTHYPNQELK
jgi:hypothetical protein